MVTLSVANMVISSVVDLVIGSVHDMDSKIPYIVQRGPQSAAANMGISSWREKWCARAHHFHL